MCCGVNLRFIFFILGVFFSSFSALLMFLGVVDYFVWQDDVVQAFFVSAFAGGFIGCACILVNQPHGAFQFGMQDFFLLTPVSWLAVSGLTSMPFYFTPGLACSFLDAWFESVSALTTTGMTALSPTLNIPRALLLWRAILQWVGGIGIIAMGMTVLPLLRVGGTQLLQTEFSDRSEKILPRFSQIMLSIVTVYVGLTVICTLCLLMGGMELLDAVCHGAATLSTGGLSTHNVPLNSWTTPYLEWVFIIFMTVGGSPLILYVRLLKGDWASFFYDAQLRAYVVLILISAALMLMWDYPLGGIRKSVFSAASVITSTGFDWDESYRLGGFAQTLCFILTFIGGCSGSTAGGIKIFRFQVLFSLVMSHLKLLRRPHGIYVSLYHDQKISESVATAVFTFVILYIVTWMVLALTLSACGLCFKDSLIYAASSLGSVGPNSSMIHMGAMAKMLLMLGMVLGRLEILTFILLFHPSFWKK